jgi:hypothetical protein
MTGPLPGMPNREPPCCEGLSRFGVTRRLPSDSAPADEMPEVREQAAGDDPFTQPSHNYIAVGYKDLHQRCGDGSSNKGGMVS